MNYLAPLESESNVVITGHGARSITGVELGLDIETITEKQLAAIPGISAKGAWKLISARAKYRSKGKTLENIDEWFSLINSTTPEFIEQYPIFN